MRYWQGHNVLCFIFFHSRVHLLHHLDDHERGQNSEKHQNVERFRELRVKIPKLHHGFNREEMNGVWKALVNVLIQFTTCEGRYESFHSHIFPMLNIFARMTYSIFHF